jgi:hypothetical protein
MKTPHPWWGKMSVFNAGSAALENARPENFPISLTKRKIRQCFMYQDGGKFSENPQRFA